MIRGILIVWLVACHASSVFAAGKHGSLDRLPAAGNVAIDRDEWGVAHIFAAREADGFYGLGYATSEDQPARFYLEVLRTRGDVAAHVTPEELAAPLRAGFPRVEDMIQSDYRAKLWGVRSAANAAVVNLDPRLRTDYAAYLQGVEKYAQDHPDKIPGWRPGDVSVADLVAIVHNGFWDDYEGGVAVDDCTRGGAVMKTAALVPLHGGYSNEWALAPPRTAKGEAVLLTDPHGGMDGRFAHEFTFQAGPLRTAGFALGPVMILGRNDRVGWGLTTGAPDVADCYAIKMLPGDDSSYRYDDEIRHVEQQTLTIEVKGRPAVAVAAKYATVNDIRSPVVSERGDTLFAAVTPYLQNLAGLHNAVYRMNRAHTTDEFYSAVATGGMFPQNLLAVDTRGEMIYIHAGLVPVRPDPSIDWTRPVSGNDSRFAWKGIHPLGDLVTIRSPRSGYIENNNTDPRFMDAARPPETIGKPEYLLTDGSNPSDAPSTRATIFIDLVSRRQTFNERAVFELAFNVESYKWDAWLKLIKNAIESRPAAALASGDFTSDLLAFNGKLDRNSTAALKYVLWREALRDLLEPRDGNELAGIILRDDAPSPRVADMALQALRSASLRLAAMPKGLSRTYGDTFVVEASGVQLPMSGGSMRPAPTPRTPAADCAASRMLCAETLLAVHYREAGPNTRIAVSGTRIMRLDFFSAKGIRSFDYQNPGVSDDDASIHAHDQTEQLVSKQVLKPVLFDARALRGHVVSRQTLLVTPP